MFGTDIAGAALASHVFAEPGTLEKVAALARDWFTEHFLRARRVA